MNRGVEYLIKLGEYYLTAFLILGIVVNLILFATFGYAIYLSEISQSNSTLSPTIEKQGESHYAE